MRRTPAEFARVKIRYPQWYIQRTLPCAAVPSFTAVEIATGRRIRCASLAEPEGKLTQPCCGRTARPRRQDPV
jgi:hypothetical protein